jgi:hypothetical protein
MVKNIRNLKLSSLSSERVTYFLEKRSKSLNEIFDSYYKEIKKKEILYPEWYLERN